MISFWPFDVVQPAIRPCTRCVQASSLVRRETDHTFRRVFHPRAGNGPGSRSTSRRRSNGCGLRNTWLLDVDRTLSLRDRLGVVFSSGNRERLAGGSRGVAMNAPWSLARTLSEILHGCPVCRFSLAIVLPSSSRFLVVVGRQRGISIDYSSFWVHVGRCHPVRDGADGSHRAQAQSSIYAAPLIR
jgi:hypothetical protein